MLSLDQVRLLENRVVKAVGKIESLTDENTRLKTQLSGLQARVSELEGLVRSFKDDQGRIEEGILNALDRLSAFEDSVYSGRENAAVPETASTPGAGYAPKASSESLETVHETAIHHTEKAAETVPQTEIEADWNSSGEETPSAASPENGQMDIF
jgi:chromosome segregation ATPase